MLTRLTLLKSRLNFSNGGFKNSFNALKGDPEVEESSVNNETGDVTSRAGHLT